MITDNRTQFRIISTSTDQLTIQSPSFLKITYKQFDQVSPVVQGRLRALSALNHNHLLKVHRVQNLSCTLNSMNTNKKIGIYHEHHVGSLDKYIVKQGQLYLEEQIVTTFQPILQVIQYLEQHTFYISTLTMKNIVITQNQQVKFMDQVLINPHSAVNYKSKGEIYQKLCQMIYDLLMQSHQNKKAKSWKDNLRLVKQKWKKQTYDFFYMIISKSNIQIREPQKKKKITKKRKCLQGKQNQIIQ